jgi:fructoselysine 6-kinase
MDLVSVGDNVVDCYPQLGLMFPGGNALNVAVQGRRSGLRTDYLGAIGDDRAGELVKSALDAEGVNAPRLRVLPGRTASAAVELVDGDRVFHGSDKGVSFFTPTRADLEYVGEFTLAHTSYCSGMEQHVPALAARCLLSFDFSDWYEPEYAEPLLAKTHVATFSGSTLNDNQIRDLIGWAHRQGPSYIVVTMGERGALLSDGGDLYHQPSVTTAVVDTLGAGDAFLARTLVGLLRGDPHPQTLSAAAAAAADTCTHHGAFGRGGALPDDPPLAVTANSLSTITTDAGAPPAERTTL